MKSLEKDGYTAVQIGFEEVSEKRVNKPLLGHFKKHESVPTKIVREFKLDSADEQLKPGQKIGVEILDGVKTINISGISKGRGHAGTVKRYNFKRGRETHGNTNVRERGSAGANSYPARIFPGLKMSGHMGNQKVTIRNLEIVALDKEAGLVFVKGSVPGPNKGYLFLTKNSSK
jgi:large subunit ribosomal protein L3